MLKSNQQPQLEGHKLMYHPNEVAKWLQKQDVAPIYVEIGPVRACNHNCSFCAFDYLKKNGTLLDKDILISNLQNMAEYGVKSIMFCGEGEPFLHPHLPEIIQKAKEFGLDIAVTSNGVLFTSEKAKATLPYLSWIKFSVDAGSPKIYAKTHGTTEEDFNKLLNNLKFACQHKKENNFSVQIGCQMVITDESINDVENLIIKIKDFDLNYLVLKPYCIHPQSINKQTLTQEDYDSKLFHLSKQYSTETFKVIYRGQSFKETEKEALDYDHCYGINFIVLIDALGNVLPCSVFYDKSSFIYGNINQQKFSEIWKSEKRKEVTNLVYQRGSKNCRNHCRLNFVNKYLNEIKNQKKTHINFI